MENPAFKRVLVSRETTKETVSWDYKEEQEFPPYKVEAVGEMCDDFIKRIKTLNKEVIISDGGKIKIKEEGGREYYLIPQEAILMY